MLDAKQKRKGLMAPVLPKQFAEDAATKLEDLEKPRRPAHTEGSVYHHAKKLVASSAGTTDDSSLCSDVELIISELENVTQVSDASSCTLKDSDTEYECTDLKDAMRSVLEHNRQLMLERMQLRKSLFAQVMQKIDEEEREVPTKTALHKAVFALVTDLGVRQDFLKALEAPEIACLLYTRGRVAGVYAHNNGSFSRLFGVENAPSLVKDRQVTKWFTWDAGKLRPADKKHAIAFDF